MSLSVTLSPSPLTLSLPFSQTQTQLIFHSLKLNPSILTSLRIQPHRFHASRRVPNFSQGDDNFVDDRRNWNRSITSDFGDDDEEGEEEEDEEEDRSLDLLVKFVENVFKKISRRARKAARSVLPVAIPTRLVGFSVNGVLILAFLWVLKAFLEVVCTLGSVVFVSILLIRGIWTGVTYFQENRTLRMKDFDDDNRAWNSAQPAA